MEDLEEKLLKVNGMGPETVDSILLYAGGNLFLSLMPTQRKYLYDMILFRITPPTTISRHCSWIN